jgi:PAS domain-containing protein
MGAEGLVAAREALARAAADVRGLDSLIVGARAFDGPPPRTDGAEPTAQERPAVVISVWNEAEAMVRAIGNDEQDRFLEGRLHLPFSVLQAAHYEIVGRAFAALPPVGSVYLRMTSFRAGPNEEARLIETLRIRQRRLVELGLVASHVGRRVVGGECEAITIGVWPDRTTVGELGGAWEQPMFQSEIAHWADRMRFDTFDGIEIAPRLPDLSGPPLFVMDGELRIVDVTATAAATLGWTSVDLVGQSVPIISRTDPTVFERNRRQLVEQGWVVGEGSWVVPEAGEVFVRYVAARDRPIPGRHAVVVRRWNEPPPTFDDLEVALRAAFPTLGR